MQQTQGETEFINSMMEFANKHREFAGIPVFRIEITYDGKGNNVVMIPWLQGNVLCVGVVPANELASDESRLEWQKNLQGEILEKLALYAKRQKDFCDDMLQELGVVTKIHPLTRWYRSLMQAIQEEIRLTLEIEHGIFHIEVWEVGEGGYLMDKNTTYFRCFWNGEGVGGGVGHPHTDDLIFRYPEREGELRESTQYYVREILDKFFSQHTSEFSKIQAKLVPRKP